MKNILFFILLFLVYLPLSFGGKSFNKKSLLILEEIQKSIESDFNLKGKIEKVIIIPNKYERGKRVVQKQLEENRKRLGVGVNPKSEKSLSGKEKIQMMLAENRKRVKNVQKEREQKRQNKIKSVDWMESKQNDINNWQNKKLDEISAWEEEKIKIINNWIKEKAKYVKRIPEYKKNLPPLPIPPEEKSIAPRVITKVITTPVFSDYHIIDNAFDHSVKDQGGRPTCASFAGVRAIEILLARMGKDNKLSEQYFFWASKPKCQKSPCPKQGSWILTGYKNSQAESHPDIPLEKNCPYNKKSVGKNVTQTPLITSCKKGYAKIKTFHKITDFTALLTALKDNNPVVGGFKLSKSFYKNRGYVFIKNPQGVSGKLDSHAEGHALLMVGFMKLPKELHKSEGKFCIITANSWGLGWGKGGHACISEKWIKKYRYKMSFIALNSVWTI